jgi:hypothetical protein
MNLDDQRSADGAVEEGFRPRYLSRGCRIRLAKRARRVASSKNPWDCPGLHRQQTLALQLFAGELAGAADGFRLLPDSPLGGFFIMAAEFHLAEYAFALHLPLQHLKGLVDIVVADENLHAVFLFDRAVNGPDGQGARGHWRTDTHNSAADSTRGTNQRQLKACLPMGTMAANCKNTETSVRRRLLSSSSGQASACPYTKEMGMPEIKNNRSRPLLCYRPRLIHLFHV